MNGWIWWSTRKATGALTVRDGVITDTPPYFRYMRGRLVPGLWLGYLQPDVRVVWYMEGAAFPLVIR